MKLPCPGWKGLAIATLPDGRNMELPYAVFSAVWKAWCDYAPLAAQAGVGLAIEQIEGDTDELAISSVYSPRWEGFVLVIRKDGTTYSASEQQCPF